MTLPIDVLTLVEEVVDRDVRRYRPCVGQVFHRVRVRCRRAGWALNPHEAREVHRVARVYIASLRVRPRSRHIGEVA